jgi:hypothetical protein
MRAMNDDLAGTGAVLALWNDVTPEVDAEYNTWHANEHVPERLTVPGMLWGLRYRRLGDGATPRYLTLYGMRDAQVLESEAYRRLLSRPTPMSARMRPHLRNVSRWVCELREALGFFASSHLAVWTFDAEDAARLRAGEYTPVATDFLLAQRSMAAAPLPWLTDGQAHAIEGSWLLAVGMPAEALEASEAARGAMLYGALPVRPALHRP